MTAPLRTRTLSLLLLCAMAPPALAQTRTAAQTSESETVEGTLASGDELRGGRYTDSYSVTLATQGTLTVRLRSDEFDTAIELVSPSGHTINRDDCSALGFVNCVVTRDAERGDWTVRVTSVGGTQTGAYMLSVLHPKISAFTTQPATPEASTVADRSASLLIPITASTTVNGGMTSTTPEQPLLTSNRVRRALPDGLWRGQVADALAEVDAAVLVDGERDGADVGLAEGVGARGERLHAGRSGVSRR